MMVAIAKGPHSLHNSLKVIEGEDVFKLELYQCLDTTVILKTRILVYTFLLDEARSLEQKRPKAKESLQ